MVALSTTEYTPFILNTDNTTELCSDTAGTVNVLAISSFKGLWCVLRDHLRIQCADEFPGWFIFNFLEVRESAHCQSKTIDLTDSESITAAYAFISERYPELATGDGLNTLESIELRLHARINKKSLSHSMSPAEAACLMNYAVSFYQLYAGGIRHCLDKASSGSSGYTVGASFSGPLFFGFVHRLMERAVADGVKQLYFLARDGQVLIEIAKVIQKHLGFDELELRYLYVSRQAMRFPSILRLGEAELEWIFEEMDNSLSSETIARRLRMSVDDFVSSLSDNAQATLKDVAPTSVLAPGQVQILRSELLSNTELREGIEARATEARHDVVGYFKQEGLFDHSSIGLVDVGWKGTLQDAIQRVIFETAPTLTLKEYYFGVSEYSANTSPKNQKVPFFLYPSSQPGHGPLFELLLLADHGMTLGYETDESHQWLPITKQTGAHLHQWGLSDYFSGVRDFSDTFCRSLSEFGSSMELHYDAVVSSLIDLLSSADRSIAESIGDLPYSGNSEESNLRKIAPPFTTTEALNYVFGSNETRGDMTHWIAASRARSAVLPNIILRMDFRIIIKEVAKIFVSRSELRGLLQKFRG